LIEVSVRVTSKVITSTIMKRLRQTEDEFVLREITKASDAIRKKYKQLQEQKYVK